MTDRPVLVIAASTKTFDNTIIHRWEEEGFDVHYEHVDGGSRSSIYAVEAHGDNLEPGERYAIVRYPVTVSPLCVILRALVVYSHIILSVGLPLTHNR